MEHSFYRCFAACSELSRPWQLAVRFASGWQSRPLWGWGRWWLCLGVQQWWSGERGPAHLDNLSDLCPWPHRSCSSVQNSARPALGSEQRRKSWPGVQAVSPPRGGSSVRPPLCAAPAARLSPGFSRGSRPHPIHISVHVSPPHEAALGPELNAVTCPRASAHFLSLQDAHCITGFLTRCSVSPCPLPAPRAGAPWGALRVPCSPTCPFHTAGH